jgi:hypothetical protein
MATKITTPELFNLSSNNTAATQLPVFTKSARPTPTTSTVQVEYLVIGGGGAGGCWGGGGGAGGYLTNYGGSKTPLTSGLDYAVVVGEGGVKPFTSFPQTTRVAANPGEDSSIIGTGISVIADGGGGGGGMVYGSSTTEFPAQNGGSGGGASAIRNATSGGSATTSQGNDGGDSPAQDPNFPGGGGGGGASSAGGDGQSASGSPAYAAGNGGDGVASSITGTSITRAGGGGGFTYGISVTNVSSGGTGGGGAGGRYVSSSNSYNPSQSDGEDGAANTGSGGGSASATGTGSGSQWYGGLPGGGGSGIVILRYPTNSSPVIKTTGSLVYTESTDGSDTVIQFTEGSGNVSFVSAGIAVGEMIFNSTTEKVEYWDGFQWNMIKDEGILLSTTDPFGDGSQTALYKFAGNGSNENGTYTANVTASYVTGILGGGVSFGGSSSSLVTSMQPLSLGQSKTLWINFDSINFNADKQFYFAGGSTSSYNFWSLALYYQHSTGLFYLGQQIRNASNSYWYAGTGYTLNNVSKTDWNLIYASYSAGNFTYSINNSTIATNPKTISMNAISSMSTNHDLGRIYSNGTPYYTASGTKISSMRQFNRELVQSEIQQIYDQVY